MIRRPPRSPLFPYTPLSRSERTPEDQAVVARWAVEPADAEPRVRHGRGDPRMRTEVRRTITGVGGADVRSEEHTSELQSRSDLVCRLLLEKKKKKLMSLDSS